MKLFHIEEQISDKAVVHVLQQIDDHATQTNERLESMDTKLDKLVEAFPNSDFEGHRRYHQTMIETLNEKRRLRIAIQEKTISGLIWAVIVFVGASVWGKVSAILIGVLK